MNAKKQQKKKQKKTSTCLKELSQSKRFLSIQFSTIDFYILNRYITSHNKKSLQRWLNAQQKILSSLTRNCSLLTITVPHSQLTQLLLTSHNMNYPRKNPIYLKQVYTSLSNQIKFENLISSLSLKRLIIRL